MRTTPANRVFWVELKQANWAIYGCISVHVFDPHAFTGKNKNNCWRSKQLFFLFFLFWNDGVTTDAAHVSQGIGDEPCTVHLPRMCTRDPPSGFKENTTGRTKSLLEGYT